MLAADYCNGLPFCLDVSLYDVSSLSYDDNGNILTLSRRDSAGVVIDTLNYNYSSSNRLQSLTENTASTAFSWDAEDANYEYDANGNVISQTEDSNYKFRTIHYDNRNLPVFVELDDFTDIIYLYNADGQRVFKKVDSQDAEHYIMDGSLNVGVFDENGLLKHWNIVAGGVAGRVESGGKLYYLKDHLGSTRSVVNESGAVVESHDYYPFGLQMPGRSFPAANTATKEKFTGKERDTETGLDYFGARYYDPSIGRFFGVDAFADKYPSMTPYHYVLNNPLRFTDITGDTVDVDSQLLEPVVYTEGENKGQQKKVEDMTLEESQQYFFQQWWSTNSKAVQKLFGLGGKFETTNVSFSLGTKPLGFFEKLLANKGTLNKYRGLTTFAERATNPKDFYTGSSEVNASFGVDKLDFIVYFNPNPAGGARFSTPGHEFDHVKIIFDRVRRGQTVPIGLRQHELMGLGKIPVLR